MLVINQTDFDITTQGNFMQTHTCKWIKRSVHHLCLSLLLGTLFSCQSSVIATTTTWHVDADNGSDQANGLTQANAFASIQHGINQAQPGDTVLIYPGVYFEHLQITHAGQVDNPIRIMTDQVAKDRVIVTGAVEAIRNKTQTWELVDQAKLLYRTPLNYKPVRVLADHVDLLPYQSLSDLNAFWFLASDYPGHDHGYAWVAAENMLYVRLRADMKYNTSTDPNQLTMAVAPPTGGGTFGSEPNGSDNFNISLPFIGSANIIIDGITFETPGIAGVYTQASDLTIRNCWFYGCRSAVAGARDDYVPGNRAHRVILEQSYYTQFPTYSDIQDVIAEHAQTQQAKSDSYQKIMHWQRKGNYPNNDGVGRTYAYENGLVMNMGQGWILQNNHIYESFEGISASANHHSQDTIIINNHFERICDNAVETENHAQNITIANNLLIDAYEPFSWQPLGGSPLPGSIYIYDNVIYQTPEDQALWTTAGNWPGVLKIGTKNQYWEAIYGVGNEQTIPINNGLWMVHNTIIKPRGRVLTYLNKSEWPLDHVYFLNNVIATWRQAASSELGNIFFDYNMVWPTLPVNESVDPALENVAGPNGQWIPQIHIPSNWQNPLEGMTNIPDGITSQTHPQISLPLPLQIQFRQQIGSILPMTAGPQPRHLP
ncbi:MAG TPA: hypothetical protein DER01_02095 [Phycisphaerales bacterium]|nr:hypothetical protein [Phycisphaerales bacterium]